MSIYILEPSMSAKVYVRSCEVGKYDRSLRERAARMASLGVNVPGPHLSRTNNVSPGHRSLHLRRPANQG